MITYADNLYLSDKVKKKNTKKTYVESIMDNIEKHRGMFGVTFIAMAKNEKDVFDIIPAYCFKQKHFTEENIYIIGIVDSNDAAFDFVKEQTDDYLNNGNGLSMREFYLKKCNKE